MQESFSKTADVQFGILRQNPHEHDGKYRLMVLKVRGVESQEACKGVTTLDHDLKDVAIALYRAAYYDVMRKAADTFTAETSHVKFVTDKLRQTHKATPTHWRLGMDVKLAVEVFDSVHARSVRCDDIEGRYYDMDHLVVFSHSPSHLACFDQEDLHSYIGEFNQTTFEESYMQDQCLVTMSDEQIAQSKSVWQMHHLTEAEALVRQLKINGGNVAGVRQAHYDKHRPNFLGELVFEASLLEALKIYLMSVFITLSSATAGAAASAGAAAAAAAIPVSTTGSLLYAVPSPYCELARMEHTSHQSLMDQCASELAKQEGSHIAAMATIFRRRYDLADEAIAQVNSKEYEQKQKGDKEDSELHQLKERFRTEHRFGSMGKFARIMDCFFVALIGAMKVAVETTESAPLSKEKLVVDAADAGEKRKAFTENKNEEEEKEAGPSTKKVKR